MNAFRLLVSCALALSALSAKADEIKAPPVDERGAVLCIWSIAMVQLIIGESCFAERDREYLSTLRWSIREMDAFIIRNSTTSAAQLASNKAKMRDETLRNLQKNGSGICQSQDAMVFYPEPGQMPTRQAVELFTKKLLEVDRPPVMNPCL